VFKGIQNRALRPMIPLAVLGKMAQAAHHGLQFADLLLQLIDYA
jgi:hypothetical protein